MAHREAPGFDRWTRIWLGCAGAWSLLPIIAGFVVKAYSGNTTDGVALPGTTLVQQNGLKVVWILVIPLAGVAIVSASLRHRHRVDKAGVGAFSWIVITLVGFLVLLGALSIGPYVAPVAVFLLVAALRVQGSSPSRRDVTTEPIDGPTRYNGLPL